MTTDMNEAEGFLADICANPADDAPRLIFADWLEEHGFAEQAEFIRLQIELAALPDCQGRKGNKSCLRCSSCQTARQQRYQERWLFGRLGEPEVRIEGKRLYVTAICRRGFVGEIILPLATFRRHGPALVRQAPLETVRLSDCRISNDGERWSLVRRRGKGWPFGRIGWHKSRAEAEAAVSRACLEWARRQAGLQSLTTGVMT